MIEILKNVSTVLVPATATFIAAKIAAKSMTFPEESKTARLIFDNVYSKIFVLLEHQLYQTTTLQQTREIGVKINNILELHPGYYYPSLKIYCERLIDSNHSNFQEHFDVFCDTFNRQYDICCKKIGVPLRSAAFRLNRRHYKGKFGFWSTYFSLPGAWAQPILFVAFLVFFYYINIIR